MKSFDALIAINKEEESILRKEFPGKKILYCPMGVKFQQSTITEEKSSPGSYTIAYYGGLGNPRNVAAAMVVYGALRKSMMSNKNLHYKIIGSNPPEQLRDLANKNQSVTITGYVDDLAGVLRDVVLAVIPFEGKYGFRSRIIELMFYGVPVLTTQDAIWGMGFTDKKNIFIYNKDQDLETIIMQLLHNAQERDDVAKNAKKKVDDEFTFHATYDSMARELKRLTV